MRHRDPRLPRDHDPAGRRDGSLPISRALRAGPGRRLPLAVHVAKASVASRAALITEVGDALKSYVSGDTLEFPIEALLASARK